MLCERFATSKLKEFEDLSHIATFGFRGEALASISHVAHLKVTSQTQSSPCAYKGIFLDGKMVAPDGSACAKPTPCAGVRGTTIVVEDLFYNTPLRLKAVKNVADEYQRVVELVARYALHYSGTSLTCKKQGENGADVHTLCGASLLDNVKALFGFTIARELVNVVSKKPEVGLLSLDIWATNANFNVKKGCFILFINNRLVDCTPVKKAIDSVYAALLPKGSHPWAYVSLQIDPPNVDVNVHPTKKEVRFLHETEIVQAVQDALSAELAKYSASRTLVVGEASTLQHSSPAVPPSVTAAPVQKKNLFVPSVQRKPLSALPDDDGDDDGDDFLASAAPKSASKPTQNKTVRVDATVQTLDSFLVAPSAEPALPTPQPYPNERQPSPLKIIQSPVVVSHPAEKRLRDEDEEPLSHSPDPAAAAVKPESKRPSLGTPLNDRLSGLVDDGDTGAISGSCDAPLSVSSQSSASQTQMTSSRSETIALPRRRPPNYSPCSLTSVMTAVQELETKSHQGLENILSGCTFVGFVDSSFILLQHQTRLYLCNFSVLCLETLRQQVFMRFSNFDRIHLSKPLSLKSVLDCACHGLVLNKDDSETVWTAVACMEPIMRMREMLSEYFSIEITSEGMITALPQIIDGYAPNIRLLPWFFYNLASKVNWTLENECFFGIAFHLARFYLPRPPSGISTVQVSPPPPSAAAAAAAGAVRDKATADEEQSSYERSVKHVLLPAIKNLLYPPRCFANDGTFVQIASLETLYKVFERC